MKVAIYMRVSTTDQHLENQEIRLRDYCKMKNWNIVDIYRDQISGAKSSRPGLNKLELDARKRRFDVVVAVKLDRLGRSTRDLIRFVDTLHHYNIDIALTDQPIDTTSSMGKFFFTVLGAVAELERDLITENVAGRHSEKQNN